MGEYAETVQAIRERVADDTFRIAVVGEFSSGKSTFINALIGKDLLTHAVSETTAAITCLCNVPAEDKRLGSCLLEYRDGSSKIIGTDELMQFTTTQSSENVVEKVRRVSVYVHFSEAEYPIEIIDTPGLNGVADKLRDITIEEVRKAHACIYLLSGKGITSSDADFIRILQRYQSNFIFVHNFIDQIKTSEGESLEKTLNEDIRLIETKVGKAVSGAEYFNYKISGISALKKLCSVDESIKRLYRNDIHDLTQSDRQRLEEESNFKDFENLLSELTTEEKYKDAVISSALQATEALIDRILPTAEQQMKINMELQKQDSQTARVEKLKKYIENLNSRREGNRKKLSNFIVARDATNRKFTKEFASQRIDEAYEEICEDIEKKITNFDDLDLFVNRYQMLPHEYFGQEVSNILNYRIIPDIDERISKNLSHLYDEATEEVKNYATNFTRKSVDEIKIKIKTGPAKFESDNTGFENTVTALQKQQALAEKQKNDIEKKRSQYPNNINELKNKLREERKKRDEKSAIYDQKIKALGSRPAVKKTTVTKYKEEYRGGFFGSIADFFCGPKVVSYEEVEEDDSARREWDKAHTNYLNQRQIEQQKYNSKMASLENEISNLQKQQEKDESKLKFLNQDIKHCQELIAQENEKHEQVIKRNKSEYCRNQKKKLKAAIESTLRGTGSRESALERIEAHIDRMSDRNIATIKERIDKYYIECADAQEKALQERINQTTQQLEERYKVEEKEVDIMNDIKKIIKEQ